MCGCDTIAKKIMWGCGVIIVILIIVLVIISFSSLEATEVGLDYSSISVEIDESQLYSGGRHYLGLSHSFMTYPTQLQPIYFNGQQYEGLGCRTFDGLYVTINLGFQYRVKNNVDDIVALFYKWPALDYQDGYERITRNAVKDTVSHFTAFELVYNRTVVEAQLRLDLSSALDKYHANIENIQLLDIEFPREFDGAISDTQNEDLKIQTALFNQTKIQNQKDGEVMQAQTQTQVIINQANASAYTMVQAAEGLSLIHI
eukprot:TRINITY_DN335_c0_g1_i9.p1 TRINITY_DN335_c0_g1~~TRINITY_DN335_c0_g1_i9.p1  ORF type:complete len:258 (-),score=49.83 TRINITY_DN335_c0_g1_i9:62-835(-)